MKGMIGWDGTFPEGLRPCGVHPLASIGGPPESRGWKVGDPYREPIIHATALVHAFCTVDAGLKRATRIGARSFLMARTHVGHDAQIGHDCELGAGVVICGHVQIGDNVRIGGNTWVKPRVRIGDGAVIGGGSVVTKDVPAGEVWAGNPARPLEQKPDFGYGCGNRPVGKPSFWARPVTARFPTEKEIAEHLYGKGAYFE